MGYTPTTWTTGDTITATKLNKIENGIAGAGGYDLIIRGTFQSNTASEYEILEGNILDCEDKLDNGDPVNGLLIVTRDWSFTPSTANTNKSRMFAPLTFFNPPYCTLAFGCVYYEGDVKAYRVSINYDYETGDLTEADYTVKTL